MPTAPGSRLRITLAAALVLFALTRLWDLGAWPLFTDEAQHLHWARRIWKAPLFLRPLTDGKALQVLAGALVVPFVEDPVRAGRLLSVFAGAVSLAAAYGIARELGGRAAAAAASLLYAVLPFAVVHERLALADPFLAAASGLVLLFTLRVLRTAGRRDAVLLGLALGAAVLAKVPGLMFFAVPAAALVPASSRPARRPLVLAVVLGLVLAALPAGYFFTSTAQLEEKLDGPDSAVGAQGLVLENAGYAASWSWTYLTPGVALLALAGLGMGVARGPLPQRLTALAAVLPVAAFLPAFHWFPRYILPAAIPLVALAGVAAAALLRAAPRPPLAAALLAALTLLPALRMDVLAVREPARVLPPVDRFQYVDGWPAGTAGDDAWRTIARAAGDAPSLVVVDAAGHSTVHYVVRTRFMNEPSVEVLMSDVGDAHRSGLLHAEQARRRVFVVVTTRRRGQPRPFPPEGLRATLLRELHHGDGVLAGRLYEVFP